MEFNVACDDRVCNGVEAKFDLTTNGKLRGNWD